MNVTLATKTLTAIEKALAKDQGASFRQWQQKTLPHIGDAYRGEDEGHRTHLGASLMGEECGRSLWYTFRWFTKKQFDGRTLRLFNRGHLEEGRFIALLLMIGVQVYQQDANGNQYRISSSEGHLGGSGDGVGVGIPDLPHGTPGLLEFKTHGEKSFMDLKAKGVRASKFTHFVQMQLYMYRMGLAAALYMATNKNTDELYAEIVTLDKEVAEQFLDRGDKIIWSKSAPSRINESPGFYKCRFCDHRPVCHLKTEPDKNCRSCIHSTPTTDKGWLCGHPDRTGLIPENVIPKGCPDYEAFNAD